jgi:predicted Zn-dependent peptidase
MVVILSLLAEAYKDPYLTAKGLESEKAAIHTETRIFGLDDIVSEMELALLSLIYSSNPIRRRADSEISELEKIKHTSSIRRLLRNRLVPSRTFVNIFGPSHVKSMELARRLIGDWSSSKDKGEESKSGKPDKDKSEESKSSKPDREKRTVDGYDGSDNFPILRDCKEKPTVNPMVKGYYLMMGFPIPEHLVKFEELAGMVADIIAFESFESLRTQNFDFYKGVYRVVPVVNISFINGLMYFWTASSSKDGVEMAEKEILKQCQRIFRGFIDPALFDALKYRTLMSWTSIFKGYTDILAEEVIDHIVQGDWDLRRFHKKHKRIEGITLDKVKKMAAKMFAPPHGFNYAKVYVGPE